MRTTGCGAQGHAPRFRQQNMTAAVHRAAKVPGNLDSDGTQRCLRYPPSRLPGRHLQCLFKGDDRTPPLGRVHVLVLAKTNDQQPCDEHSGHAPESFTHRPSNDRVGAVGKAARNHH